MTAETKDALLVAAERRARNTMSGSSRWMVHLADPDDPARVATLDVAGDTQAAYRLSERIYDNAPVTITVATAGPDRGKVTHLVFEDAR